MSENHISKFFLLNHNSGTSAASPLQEVVIVERSGRLLARTGAQERFVGLRQFLRFNAAGIFLARNLEWRFGLRALDGAVVTFVRRQTAQKQNRIQAEVRFVGGKKEEFCE